MLHHPSKSKLKTKKQKKTNTKKKVQKINKEENL